MPDRHPYALLRCDACGRLLDAPRYVGSGAGRVAGELSAPVASPPLAAANGAGLLLFVRGDEVRYEEPPLCAHCSVAIGVTALVRWAEEEEEG